jgi:hypothetical protein
LRRKLNATIGSLFWIRRLAREVGRKFQCQIGVDLQIHGDLCRGRCAGPEHNRRINVI